MYHTMYACMHACMNAYLQVCMFVVLQSVEGVLQSAVVSQSGDGYGNQLWYCNNPTGYRNLHSIIWIWRSNEFRLLHILPQGYLPRRGTLQFKIAIAPTD